MATWETRRRRVISFLIFTGILLLAAFVYEMGSRVRLRPVPIGTDLLHLLGYTAASFLRMPVSYTHLTLPTNREV